jgi:hypothetical protein
MQSTLNIFQHLIKNIPPLFPAEIKSAMEQEYFRFENSANPSLAELEASMIKFGYEVWPWRQAFIEFVKHNEEQLGEHFLLPKLSLALQERYKIFRNYGGSLGELTSGRPAQFFTLDERMDITPALVAMEEELEIYTVRMIISTNRAKYLEQVSKFCKIFEEIKGHIDALYNLAATELDHPQLADEIRARVCSFEHGLCLLGPEIHLEEIKESLPFFHGRRHELNHLRGIHIPARINFD